ncbi:hypothetical protein BACI71_70115 [Bacillus mycoides]|uniref:Uncharacterized protein n=1 Tax=Bacillus mycoides TaxID=1405 RepID=A0A654B3S6_BACMY|nr:hypothetical protein BACI71_70115 [Bacillus mycoides]
MRGRSSFKQAGSPHRYQAKKIDNLQNENFLPFIATKYIFIV